VACICVCEREGETELVYTCVHVYTCKKVDQIASPPFRCVIV